jgi:hypothetical protein
MSHNRKDTAWLIPDGTVDRSQAQLAVLMDIRDELKELNRTLSCYRVRNMADAIPRIDLRLKKHFGPLTKRKKRA